MRFSVSQGIHRIVVRSVSSFSRSTLLSCMNRFLRNLLSLSARALVGRLVTQSAQTRGKRTYRYLIPALVTSLAVGQNGPSGGRKSTGAAEPVRIHFADATEKAGIRFEHFHGVRSIQLPEDMGSGAAWGDYDNDGCPDLYVVDVAGPLTNTPEQMAHSTGGNRLYHNNCNGTFTDVTTKAGVGFKGTGMGAAWADFDNDGHEDLVVTSYDRIILYHNNGDGTFRDVTEKAGLGKYKGFWAGAAWGDYDRDGYVDLYICGYVKYSYRPEDAKKKALQYTSLVPYTLDPQAYPPERNLLLHNHGDGTFTEVAQAAGVDDPAGRSMSAAWYDFDGDGWPDLYVADDVWGSKLYINLRNGKFKDITRESGITDYRGAMGIAIGDWEGKGDADIFVTHWIYQGDALFSNLRTTMKNSTMFFTDTADTVGLSATTRNSIGFGTSFYDFDNDGKLDLFVVNGSTFQNDKDPTRLVAMKNLLFRQMGPQDGFQEIGSTSGDPFLQSQVGRGAAFADYDNDGYMDVFIVNQEGRPELLHNEGISKLNWLEVTVKCTKSNRTGFGTKVDIETAGQKQHQEIGGQTSYMSQNFQRAHFGLSHEKEVGRLTVTFPSGVVHTIEHVRANQIVTVVE